MPVALEGRRALLAGADPHRKALRALFTAGQLPGWEAIEAESLDHARFVLQMEACDVLVLDGGLYRTGDAGDLAWLGGPHRTPVLFLADVVPGLVVEALDQGAVQWLPRGLALGYPPLLAAALRTAAFYGELRERVGDIGESLRDARLQVSRLVNLLWETTPVEGRSGWFTQRHMLDRLAEEVARAQRHGGDFTVLLGEVEEEGGERPTGTEATQLTAWTADRVTRVKRRCDVAGQYGPHGFMLLLPRTADAGAVQCCRRLRAVLEEPPALAEAGPPPRRAWFGAASFSPAASSVKSLLRRAEERLDQARVGEGAAG